MSTHQSDESEKQLRDGIRKQLDEKTWPQVMDVFGYANHQAPRMPDEEYARLQEYFANAMCPSIVQFLKLVHFNEQTIGHTMSFNFSMCRRLVPGNVEATAENFAIAFSTPDILVGTRRGVEGAAVWCKNLAAVDYDSDSLQFFDKIFEEAVVLMSGNFAPVSMTDMVDFATGVKSSSKKPAPAQ